MKFYEAHLLSLGIAITYLDSGNPLADVRALLPDLIKKGFGEIHFCHVADDWLNKRIKKHAHDVKLVEHHSPMFLNSTDELTAYFKPGKRYFQTDFYIQQRKRLQILIDADNEPLGGKWSFDADNRLKYPKGKIPPAIKQLSENDFVLEAENYVKGNFNDNYGDLKGDLVYPATYEESQAWLADFLKNRFLEFGAYEDAIVSGERLLHHGLLTPMMNVGLLTPAEVVETALTYAGPNGIPLNSLEGFIRQIIGWREFIHGVYEAAGSRERTTNFWKFDRKIPETFWTGETGILPVDLTIKKVLESGYCHHIERLMVIGNFMLLCEFDPDEVYRWFMELFIDAYDWVMVTNVYGMSQFADGGLMATKPYISGSNYLMKMSDFPKGEWQATWDGLFWRFMDVHRDFFLRNPRLGMLVRTFDKMSAEKRFAHLKSAEEFLDSLENSK